MKHTLLRSFSSPLRKIISKLSSFLWNFGHAFDGDLFFHTKFSPGCKSRWAKEEACTFQVAMAFLRF